MVLKITAGPLPADGERMKIEEAMTAFVQGTEFTDFGPDEFADGPVGFVVSATEAPVTDIRDRGTLWFKRGSGKMYKWTPQAIRSEFFSPSLAGADVSEFQWVAMSDRKEALVKCRWGWLDNMVLRMNSANSEWKFEISKDQFGAGTPRRTLVMASTAGTEGGAGLGFEFQNARFMGHHMHTDPIMIALDNAADGDYKVVLEVGFGTCLVQGPGANDNNHPHPLYHFSQGDPHYRLKATGATAWTNVSSILAYCVESAASSVEQVLQIFKPATSTNMVKDPDAQRFNNN
jgi:hypothetical protein